MVDGFPTDPLRRDNMSFGGDDHGDDFTFGWDETNLMDFDPNDDLQDGDIQQIFNPFHCQCHGFVFPKKADLNRHIAKETKRFLCNVAACPSTQPNGDPPVFGTLNDKKRHYRDVHGTDLRGNHLPKYPCPWTNCRRHSDGFPRPKNLENHLKSIHENKRPEVSAGAEGDAASQPATASPSVAASFAAPADSNVPRTAPIPASTTPSFARDSTLNTTDPTPADSQRAEGGASASAATLPPLTDEEAADPVVSEYTENITSLRASNASRSSRLAIIQRELASMQATCSTIEQEIVENKVTEHYLLSQLAKRKDTIRSARTIAAQRRRSQPTGAAATIAGGAAAAAAPQGD